MRGASQTLVEITIPEEVSLRLKPRIVDKTDDDENSETSEISLDLLAKERQEEKSQDNQSLGSASGWNPDASDYSLDVLLHKSDDDISATDSAKASLMTSDYSLNVKLSQSQSSLRSGQRLTSSSAHSLGASQHSFATSRSIARSVDTDASEGAATKSTSDEKRKVSFYPRVRILRVPNRQAMLKAQIKRVWYSREEFKDIREECFETITIMQDGELIDEDEGMCSRGLEYKVSAAYKERQRNKQEIRQAVFEEQQFQEEVGMPDAEWLARISREQSKSCVETALELAKLDEEAASLYLGGSRWRESKN
eukprot:Nitzschia sp. Nitz4//scaffold245_size28976//13484//14410//NITZ4_008072-RA/size28976-processed-gene-0.12-mRNA-1//1//CDS//3329543881//43//frame0